MSIPENEQNRITAPDAVRIQQLKDAFIPHELIMKQVGSNFNNK